MMRTQLGLSLVAAAAAGLVNVSCSTVECGPGTVERDGTCAPADEDTGNALCGGDGPFTTVLGVDGVCEVETPTVCDMDTTIEQFDPQTGITTCVGVAGGCSGEIPCSAPDAGKATLCGRIWDTETETPITMAAGATGQRCTTATTDGPCSLRLRFFDALDFAMSPGTAMPIVPEGGVYQDDCNRYRGHNMARATFGFIGIAVDDDPSITPATQHLLTGVATSNAFASPGREFHAYATKASTNTAWSTSSGIGGQTFAERGVLAIVFQYKGLPVDGVKVRRNGSLIPNDDYYFTDTDEQRTTVSPSSGLDMTGDNGTVLVTGIGSQTPIAHDGTGAEPSGCIWPSNLAAAIPGVVFVQIKEAETPAGAACP